MSRGLWFDTEAGSEVVTVVELAHQEAVCQQLLKQPVVFMDTEGQNAELISLLVPAKKRDHIYLLHNLPITKSLLKLLTSQVVLKIGFGLDNDVRNIEARCGKTMRPIVDVQAMLVPLMGFTNLNAAANRFIDDRKAFDCGYAGRVNWRTPFDSIHDERLHYSIKDVELICKLYTELYAYSLRTSMPRRIKMLDPDHSYRDYLFSFNQRTFGAALYTVLRSDLLKDTNQGLCRHAAKELVSIYWQSPVNQEVQEYVNNLLEQAADNRQRFKSIEKLTNYIFHTAWSAHDAPGSWPESDLQYLYIDGNTTMVQYLLRDYSQQDVDWYVYQLFS